jgi:hypothetical protein
VEWLVGGEYSARWHPSSARVAPPVAAALLTHNFFLFSCDRTCHFFSSIFLIAFLAVSLHDELKNTINIFRFQNQT